MFSYPDNVFVRLRPCVLGGSPTLCWGGACLAAGASSRWAGAADRVLLLQWIVSLL
jgi:hypothetical protein